MSVLPAKTRYLSAKPYREGSLAGVRIYFADPWPKKRHHKRRIIQPEFVDHLARCMASGGILHLATDWQPYAEHMLEVMQSSRTSSIFHPRMTIVKDPTGGPIQSMKNAANGLVMKSGICCTSELEAG